MKRILIAWELGANFGHIARCLQIANVLRERGHTVAFAVRDTRTAAEMLDKAKFAYFQAPQPVMPGAQIRHPINFSEILVIQGYTDPLALQGLARAWLALYHLCRPNVILADHSPTALFSAKLAGIPAIPIGTGFAMPPAVSPQPSMRPFETISEARLMQADDAVNKCMAAVSKRIGKRNGSIPTVASLYDTSPLLNTFRELDHFADRPAANYIGPIFGLPDSQTVAWEGQRKHRIFAYLRPQVKGFDELMKALRAVDAESIVVIPGLSAKQMAQFVAPNLRIYTRPVNLPAILPQTDVLITQGNAGTVAEALLAGVPMLLLPLYMEQYLGASRIDPLGASILSEIKERTEEHFKSALARLLTDKTFKQNAQAFADKYAGFDVNSPVQAAVAALEAHA